MFEREGDIVQRVIDRLREPVEMDPAIDTRVMARVAAPPAPGTRLATAWDWLRRPRNVPVSPLAALAAAAVLAGVALWLGISRAEPRTTPVRSATTVMQFVVVAHGASSVALVGDFNDWDATTTPMRPANGGGLWSVTVPLAPGRHRYAFLVNGSRWLADPAAPRVQDDFGTPSSVVTVGG